MSDAPRLQRRVVKAVSAPATGFGMPGLIRNEGFIAIADDGLGVAPQLARQLCELGVQTHVLQSPPDSDDVYGVIYLGGLQMVDNVGDAVALNRDAFTWAKQTGAALVVRHGLFITVQDTGGDFGLSGRAGVRAWSAGIAGLVKTARLEWPACTTKAIDLDCGSDDVMVLAKRLVDEITAGGPETEIGLLRDGKRVTVIDVDESELTEPMASTVQPITSDDVIVVSGGARGVTAACMEALAAAVQPKLVLLGRTALFPESAITQGAVLDAEIKRAVLEDSKSRNEVLTPLELNRKVQAILASREIQETVRSLEAQGATVRYIDVDVQDEAALEQALDLVRQSFGPITGVVHAAGIIADKPILQKTLEQFDSVLDTKVRGLQALLNVTAHDPLRVICCFSSIAARVGNLGQSDYAMANEILNKVASMEAGHREHCVVKSIGWGAWEGGMVTPSLKIHFEQLGVPLISIEAGAQAFVDALRGEGTELVIIPDGAGSLLGSAMTREWSMTVNVDEKRFPCLHDHVIAGAPVVPMAFAIDWLVRAAQACRPDLVVGACEDLRVIKGIRLDNFTTGGHWLQITMTETPMDVDAPHLIRMKTEIRAEDGKLHYQATLTMGSKWDNVTLASLTPEILTASADAEITGLCAPVPVDGTVKRYGQNETEDYNPYDEHLFHGPAFYAIYDVNQVSESVVTAEFKTSKDVQVLTEWNDADTVDAILMDAGLQAASLWGTYTLDSKTLPTSLRRYVTSGPGVPVRCIVIGKSATPMRTITDVYFFAEDGQPLSALLGLEMHVVGGKGD